MAQILVIDDNDQFRDMMREVLKNEGYEVLVASDGKKGVELYCEKRPDLIITDVNMPEKSGPELIFELQKNFSGVKIIAISGGTENSEEYLKSIKVFSDVKHIFLKPFDMDEMLDAVKNLLNQ